MERLPIAEILESIPVGMALFGLFGFAAFIFSVYSAVLLWHWKKYSTGKFTTMTNMILYLSVGGGLIIVMLLSIIWYSFI